MADTSSATPTPKKRGPGRKWVKGQSGNPKGRPKALPEVRAGMLAMEPDVMRELLALIVSTTVHPRDKVAAIRIWFDFVLPKPTEPSEGNADALKALVDALKS